MKTYSKNYFGKGTQVTTNTGFALDIVKITLGVEQIIELAHDYNGKQYITFEVAKMKGLDNYGHTHTVVSAPPFPSYRIRFLSINCGSRFLS